MPMDVLVTSPDHSDRVRAIQAALDAVGVADWPDALDRGALASLIDEAREARAQAQVVETTEYELGVNGQRVRSPMRFLASFGGAALHTIHESGALREVATRITGCTMSPTKTAYLYFREGDRIGVHTDEPACELTFLVPLGDAAPPLVVHPELRDTDPADILELARRSSGAPEGGVAIPLPLQGVLALDGRIAPHQTRPVSGAVDAVLATLCYVGDAS
jgi:hypothetical protein